MLSRSDLQALAQTRLDDAALLLKSQRFSAAYYLSGYSLELGFKAAISKLFLKNVIPDKQLVNSIYVHDLAKLANIAGLHENLEIIRKKDKAFEANWSVAVQWSEASRYEMIDTFRASEMLAAISDAKSGIFQWLKQSW